MLIPIGDDNSRRQTVPFVTWLLIATNVLVFFIELASGDDFLAKFAVLPARLFSGASSPITLVTSLFLHGGWSHILGNMLYLAIFGDNVEDNVGHFKYLIFYLLCGVASTLAMASTIPDSMVPNLGASGAISGVMAGYLILFPRNRVRILMFYSVISVRAWVVLGLWIGTQVLSSYIDLYNPEIGAHGGVAYMAHVGGFAMGILLIFLLRRPIPPLPDEMESYA